MTHDTIRAAIDALRPFAEEYKGWAKIENHYRPAAYSEAFAVGDLRRAAEALAALEAMPAQQGMDDGWVRVKKSWAIEVLRNYLYLQTYGGTIETASPGYLAGYEATAELVINKMFESPASPDQAQEGVVEK